MLGDFVIILFGLVSNGFRYNKISFIWFTSTRNNTFILLEKMFPTASKNSEFWWTFQFSSKLTNKLYITPNHVLWIASVCDVEWERTGHSINVKINKHYIVGEKKTFKQSNGKKTFYWELKLHFRERWHRQTVNLNTHRIVSMP